MSITYLAKGAVTLETALKAQVSNTIKKKKKKSLSFWIGKPPKFELPLKKFV